MHTLANVYPDVPVADFAVGFEEVCDVVLVQRVQLRLKDGDEGLGFRV